VLKLIILRAVTLTKVNMSAINFIYSKLLRRTSTFVLAIVGGVFVFERVFDQGADSLFEYMNRGVSNVVRE